MMLLRKCSVVAWSSGKKGKRTGCDTYIEIDVAAFLAIGTALVEEVEILHQQGEKWNDHFFTVAGGALGPPHGGFEGGPVTVEIAGWVHLVFENFEFLHVDFGPGPPQSTDGTHVETRDDGHERVEIPQIEAFLGHVDKVVEKADPVALFQLHAYFRRDQIGQPIEPLHVGLKISRPFHVPQCRLRKKNKNFLGDASWEMKWNSHRNDYTYRTNYTT